MHEGIKVALSIVDPDNAYRYIQIRGTVTKEATEGANAHIDSLAKKYLGKDKYPFRTGNEVRVIYKIAPEKFSHM